MRVCLNFVLTSLAAATWLACGSTGGEGTSSHGGGGVNGTGAQTTDASASGSGGTATSSSNGTSSSSNAGGAGGGSSSGQPGTGAASSSGTGGAGAGGAGGGTGGAPGTGGTGGQTSAGGPAATTSSVAVSSSSSASSSVASSSSSSASSTSASAGSGGNGGGGGSDEGGGAPDYLEVTPPSAIIEVNDGASTPVDFDALYGGIPVGAAWVVDFSAVATVDKSGLVTATGNLGGEVLVKATRQGESAEALVTVVINRTENPANATPSAQSKLRNPTGNDTAKWAYPYDDTVFPQGILPPELMWFGGGPNDVYYIKLETVYTTTEIFTTAPDGRFLMSKPVWKTISESQQYVDGVTVDVTVTRMAAGAAEAKLLKKQKWRVANGSMKGTLYYWANNLGRVLRIKPGAEIPDDFLAVHGVKGCTACHSVSADGSMLTMSGDAYVGSYDLIGNAPVWKTDLITEREFSFAGVSPNGKVVVKDQRQAGMFDSATGVMIPNTGLDKSLVTPAFAPNGSKLVYVNPTTGALEKYDYNAQDVKVAAPPTTLVQQGAKPTIFYPSVTEDGNWVVYHRGPHDTRNGPADLYLASAKNPGVEIALDKLNGAQYPFYAGARDRAKNYEPTFAPVASGGYNWVVFTSRRTYGNRLTGAADATKQLWVAAIDQLPTAGKDPSHPAFFVRGQDLTTKNMRGYWSQDPCRQTGTACGASSECCNKNCEDGVCKDPTSTECIAEGAACDTAEECCTQNCENGACAPPVPLCLVIGDDCAVSSTCCSDNCDAGKCAPHCEQEGEACDEPSDCCSQVCGAEGLCKPVCVPVGDGCGETADCCSKNCEDATCLPQCIAEGQACGADAECCTGRCKDGTCIVGCAQLGGACTQASDCCGIFVTCENNVCKTQEG